MAWTNHVVTFLFVINLGLAGVLIFLERRNIAATWAWLMILLFLPGVGFVFYLILGQKLTRRKLYKLKEGDFSRSLELVSRQKGMLEKGTMTFHDPVMSAHEDMIYMNLISDAALFTQDNAVEIFTEGQSKFDSLLQCIRGAKTYVHLLYYIVRDDDLGRKLIHELTEKAKQGVEIKLLYDDIGSSALSSRMLGPLVQAGGAVAAFFPSRIPYLNMWVNFRNHRKLAIIDGQTGYIGGFNIGNEYVGLDKKFGFWRDTHLKVQGSAVHMLQTRFILDWNISSPIRLDGSARYFPRPSAVGNVGIQIVSSGPNSEKQQIKHGYLKMIYKARKRIYLQSPYFIPDDSLLTALKMAAMSGVDVRVMVPAKADHKLVYWASHSYIGELLKSGIRVFQYENGFLHAKTMVIDSAIASVGTANIDIRSFKLNFETNAFLFDTQTASHIEHIFEQDLAVCREVTMDVYVRRPWPDKFLESITRLVSPIL